MKPGTVVIWTITVNQIEEYAKVGVVLMDDSEKPGSILVAVGALSIAEYNDSDRNPSGGFDVNSVPVANTTPVAPSVVAVLTR
jgi:hypothetical protein